MSEPLPIVDAFELEPAIRSLLRPDELLEDFEGHAHQLPRFFYRIDPWDLVNTTKFTPHFTLREFIAVDSREHPALLQSPHYIPCTVSVLARYLEEFRMRVNAPVFITVNGGYRSPAHAFSRAATPHLWGTAANIYRIGDTFLDNERSISKYASIAQELGQEVFTKPFGHRPGESDDHLHFDLGYLRWSPRETSDRIRKPSDS